MAAIKKELKPGLPIEVVTLAQNIIEKLHELRGELDVHAENTLFFNTLDDEKQPHVIVLQYDPNRGSGEYVLVTSP